MVCRQWWWLGSSRVCTVAGELPLRALGLCCLEPDVVLSHAGSGYQLEALYAQMRAFWPLVLSFQRASYDLEAGRLRPLWNNNHGSLPFTQS